MILEPIRVDVLLEPTLQKGARSGTLLPTAPIEFSIENIAEGSLLGPGNTVFARRRTDLLIGRGECTRESVAVTQG